MKQFKLFSILFTAVLLLVLAGEKSRVAASSLAAQLASDEKTISNVAMALPATTQSPIFTISGGPIEILSFVGVVTTDIQAQACNIKIVADPTTPATDTDLTAGLEINDDEDGTVYSLVTSVSSFLAEYTNGVGPGMAGGTAASISNSSAPFTIIVPIGAIDIVTTATNTGNITWSMRYRPLVPGVKVIAN